MNTLSVGFAGREKSRVAPFAVGPEVEVARHEFGAVIDLHGLRTTDLGAHIFQDLDDIFATVAEAGLQGRTETRVGVDDHQNAQLLPRSELIMDKVHRPDIVRPEGFCPILSQLRFHTPFGVLPRNCIPIALSTL